MTDEPFTLANAPPPYRPWRGEEPPRLRQQMLLEGLDCLAGQKDLEFDKKDIDNPPVPQIILTVPKNRGDSHG